MNGKLSTERRKPKGPRLYLYQQAKKEQKMARERQRARFRYSQKVKESVRNRDCRSQWETNEKQNKNCYFPQYLFFI
jgi:hypothetical protein